MKHLVCTGAALALCVAASGSVALAAQHGHMMHVPAYIKAAVASTSRPASDSRRDVNRKPGEVMAFAGVKPGMRIGELEPGAGYYSRLLCRAIGNSGHLYRVNFIPHLPPMPAGRKMPRRRPRFRPAPLGCDNVTTSNEQESALKLPSGLDIVWTTDNYHDFHDPFLSGMPVGHANMRELDQAVYDALKPGGIFLVNDHVAAAGTGQADTNTLHRIDPALVKREVEAVGFKLIGSSNILHNPKDNHTKKVFVMVDHTDEFIFKFQKPTT